VIAFYLPQFHPFKENEEWWGRGFTEWTNVGKAAPLFRGHYQPRVPADLGYYDLRIPEVRNRQAELAKEAGVSAFCYWHYWFGNGKQLMEMPLQEVVRLGEPQFPFCLGWANHSWERKNWNADVSRVSKEMLIEQTYTGDEDINNHFYTMLPAFKDERYYKVDSKLLFLFYAVADIPDVDRFMSIWQSLAKENGLPGFYFVSHVKMKSLIDDPAYNKTDAQNLSLLMEPWNNQDGFNAKVKRFVNNHFLRRPLFTMNYAKAINMYDSELFEREDVFPTIVPNWDHSPRLGSGATILYNSTPELFKEHAKMVFRRIKNKPENRQIVFLRSWNEWAEGNYMEPDLKFGKGYIEALRAAIEECR